MLSLRQTSGHETLYCLFLRDLTDHLFMIDHINVLASQELFFIFYFFSH